MGKPPGPAPQLKHTIFHEPHATMTRRIGDAAGQGRRNLGRGPKSCWVKVVRLKGKYVRSPASRPPSRCGPSSGKHPNIRTSHPLAPALECSDVRLVGQETRKRVVEVRKKTCRRGRISPWAPRNGHHARDLALSSITSSAISFSHCCSVWLGRGHLRSGELSQSWRWCWRTCNLFYRVARPIMWRPCTAQPG